MLLSSFRFGIKPGTVRNFSRAMILNDINHTKPDYVVNKAQTSNFDKRLLVWIKKYPSVKDVPNELTFAVLEQSRSKARVKASFYLMGLIGIIFIYQIIASKRQVQEREKLAHSLERSTDPVVK